MSENGGWSALEGMRLEAVQPKPCALAKSTTSHRLTDASTGSVI